MTEAAQAEGEVLPEAPETEQTPVEQPEGEQQEVQQPEKTEPEKPKELKGVGKRLHQLTSERDYWKQQAQAAQQPKEPEKPSEPVKTLEDFEYDLGKYTAYLFDLAREEARKEARREASTWREQQAAQTRRQSFETRLADFADEHPDFYDGWDTTPISAPMAEAIESSEIGPEVAYYLKNNLDVAIRIFQISQASPVKAAQEMGRIEARLDAEKAKAKQKAVSKAPAPVPKLEGADAGRIGVSPDDPASDKAMSDDEWMRARNKQLKRRK